MFQKKANKVQQAMGTLHSRRSQTSNKRRKVGK
jgi:hypothetical protein